MDRLDFDFVEFDNFKFGRTMKGEILIYQTPDGATKVDVRVEEETVWLTQAQMAALFQTTKQNISLQCIIFSGRPFT